MFVLLISNFFGFGARADDCVLGTAGCDPEFTITTTDTSDFSFSISAVGTYYLDCGNGDGVRTINKTSTGAETITCTNRTSTTIGLSGQATEYASTINPAAIDFKENTKLAGISGSLGAIFGTIVRGDKVTQPSFRYTFGNCYNLKGTIPENLFKGIYGQPQAEMFLGTFQDASKLTGSIPSGLFADLSGNYKISLFHDTFMDCSGLTGVIPGDLFGKLGGAPATRMFEDTFSECSGLTGSIPSDLFGTINGLAVNRMFAYTFKGCAGLTCQVPASLYSGIETDNYIEGSMTDAFSGSGLITQCPANQYYPGYPFGDEEEWSGKVFCENCPAGTKSPQGSVGQNACVGAVKLHVGENSAMQLSSVCPESSPVTVFDVDGKTYYGQLSDTEKTINTDTNTKYHVLYNNKEYWLHDYTVQ